jgi:hypothetical protein
MAAHQVQSFIQGTSAGVGGGVMVVSPPQRHGAKEGLDAPLAVAVDIFQPGGRLRVRHQVSVVEQLFDQGSGIPEERIAQADLQPLPEAF